MNTLLLNRSLGSSSPRDLEASQHSRLLYALQPTSTQFSRLRTTLDESNEQVAHNGGVNSIVVDKFEGRYLLSGGADATISVWDLECPGDPQSTLYKPLGTIQKQAILHSIF